MKRMSDSLNESVKFGMKLEFVKYLKKLVLIYIYHSIIFQNRVS